jgi:plastocyanin
MLFPVLSSAADEVYTLTIKDHRFQPAEITVPAGKKIKLQVENQDATPEEFESHSLNREKLIAGNAKVTIFIGPLSAGRYSFEGEFNAKTAQGVIIAQ